MVAVRTLHHLDGPNRACGNLERLYGREKIPSRSIESQAASAKECNALQSSFRATILLSRQATLLATWRSQECATSGRMWGSAVVLHRHTFATDSLVNGVPDAQVAALLGHSETAMLHKHYAQFGARAKALRDALNKVR